MSRRRLIRFTSQRTTSLKGQRRYGEPMADDLPRIKFAADSPLEERGFEPAVPLAKRIVCVERRLSPGIRTHRPPPDRPG